MNNNQLSEALRAEFSAWIELQRDVIILDGSFTLEELKMIVRMWETRGKRDA